MPDEKLKWELGIVFMAVNLFLLVVGALAVITLGVYRGLAVFLATLFLTVYIVYRYYVDRET